MAPNLGAPNLGRIYGTEFMNLLVSRAHIWYYLTMRHVFYFLNFKAMKNIKAGFSLIEAILAIILIVITAVGAFSYMVYCSRLTLQADTRIVAANFARETVEDLYKRNYSDPRLNETTGDGLSDPLPSAPVFGGAFRSRHPTATRKYTIDDMGDYKLITVKVTWDQ